MTWDQDQVESVLKKKLQLDTSSQKMVVEHHYKLGKLTFYRGHSIYQYYNDSLPTP